MGQTLWEHPLGPDDIATTPTVDRDQVFVGVDPQPPSVPVNQVLRWSVRALSASAGGLLWEHTSEPKLGARVSDPVACDDASAYVFADERLMAFDRQDGVVRWSRSVTDAMPTLLHDGCLYTNSSSELLVLDPGTGKVLRRRRCGGGIRACSVGPDGSLFVSTYRSRVLRLDAETLDVAQTYVVPGRWAVGAPAAVTDDGSTVVINSYAGFVIAMDVSTAAVRWRRKKELSRQGRVWILPGDRVLSTLPDLVMLDARSGKPHWKIAGTFVHAVLHADRVHGLAVVDGRYAHLVVDLATGTVLRRDDWGGTSDPGVNWLESGFALLGAGDDLAVTSHVPGRVTVVRL